MYRIVTDGSCDLGEKEAKALNLTVVPFYISVDGEHYKKEIEELEVREFYQFMKDNPKVFPKTSLPTVQDYIDKFEPFLIDNKAIICICITIKFSGSYNSAINAKDILLETYPEAKITIIDATVNTVLQGLLVQEACRMQQDGLEYQQVIDKINEIKVTGRIFFTVGCMDYLVNGGRVGKLAGVAAGTLGIRPIITLKEGEIHPSGLARGRNKSCKKLLDHLLAYLEECGGEPEHYSYTIGYGYDGEEVETFREEVLASILNRYPNCQVNISILQIGATIGVHTGPNPLGIGIIRKYDC